MLVEMDKKYNWVVRPGRQRGFTLVNIAAIVVSSGIMLGVAVQGKDIVKEMQYKHFYDDLTQIENVVWTHYQEAGRWPGDCNSDGVIGYKPENSVTPISDAKHGLSDSSDPSQDACNSASNDDENINAPFSDLRLLGLLKQHKSNSSISKHSAGDKFELGHADFRQFNGAVASTNAVVAYGVPVGIAKRIDNNIDGDVVGDKGRIRRWDQQQQGSAWPENGNDDELVALAFFFDKHVP